MEGQQSIDALFQFATEGILIVDQQGSIRRINPSAERLFGYAEGELVNQKTEVLVPKRQRGRHEADRGDYNQHPHARSMGAGIDLHGCKKDGSEFPVEISLSPYSSPEGKFVIAFIVDITLRKQAEERLRNYSTELEDQVRNRTLILEEAVHELEKTKADLYEALSKERELNELKSRFVSMASHEFRTPLTTMLSSLSLVSKYSEQSDIPNQQRHISKIKKSIGDLTVILNDFLSVSKLEEGKEESIPTDTDIVSFIDPIRSEMQPLLVRDQVITHTHRGLRAVRIDQKILRNILVNLLSNAIKFSPGGESIEILTDVNGSRLSLSVKDHGIGISSEDQKHLFERFFRGHNATHIQGTGLGLHIVARYSELIGAGIRVESAESLGTTFTILIPQQ